MLNAQSVVCGGMPDRRLPYDGSPLRLQLNGPEANVRLQIDEISSTMVRNLSRAFTDLLEIATYVYCADQAVTRGGADVDHMSARWRRRFFFRIPVREVDLWKSSGMQTALANTLQFLSDDEYTFDFLPALKDTPVQRYLNNGTAIGDGVEEACLFSGGLDSLGGAIQECIIDKRRVALVTHQPIKKLMSRYDALRQELTKRAPRTPVFVPVSINKDSAMSREWTQRTRSFLFMALGACVASSVGLARVRFYENGVLSFNLPPCSQVVGAKATRTTHPRVLDGFAAILSLVANRPFAVENPFLWTTKTDVVAKIAAVGCKEMIAYSTSCAHTWEKSLAHPHCGVCSQCIDRRFAVLAAGVADADPANEYKVQLLTEERPARLEQTMLAAYVESARSVAAMTELDFFSHFGEASRALRHVGMLPDSAAAAIFQLHRRHAVQVNSVIERALANHARDIFSRTLPPYCLVSMVCDPAINPSHTDSQPAIQSDKDSDRTYFRKVGPKSWEIRFAGGKRFVLPASLGATYLHALIQQQGMQVSAARLAASASGQDEAIFSGDAGTRMARADRDSLEADVEHLLHERQRANERHDQAAATRLEKETAEVTSYLESEVSATQRGRKDLDRRDQVRKSVGNAIKRAIDQIRTSDKALAIHLQPPTLQSGHVLCYLPDPKVVWLL